MRVIIWSGLQQSYCRRESDLMYQTVRYARLKMARRPRSYLRPIWGRTHSLCGA